MKLLKFAAIDEDLFQRHERDAFLKILGFFTRKKFFYPFDVYWKVYYELFSQPSILENIAINLIN